MILVLCGTVFLSLALLYMDVRESRKEAEVIRRNTYGQGSKTEEREVTVGGEKMEEPLEITVGERQYTSEEIKKVFEQNIRRLDLLILGENKSLDEVRSDLELITEIPDVWTVSMWNMWWTRWARATDSQWGCSLHGEKDCLSTWQSNEGAQWARSR